MHIDKVESTSVLTGRARASLGDHHLIIAGAVLLLVLIMLVDHALFLKPAQLILGGLYILYVPGYCLTAALFPSPDDLDGVERAGASIGLSVALIPLLVLVLNALPWGIRLWPILLSEYAVMALSMGVALRRRSALGVENVLTSAAIVHPRHWWPSLPSSEQRIYKFLAGIWIVVILAAIWVFAVPSPDEFMTEFYMLGSAGMAENFPRQTSPGEMLTVTIGVANHERDDQTYRIEVWVADDQNAFRRVLVKEEGPIMLSPGDAHEQEVSWSMPWAGSDQRIEFMLFTEDADQPYRQLQLWINVAEELPTR